MGETGRDGFRGDAEYDGRAPPSVAEALTDGRRRLTLATLAGHTAPISESALAEAVHDARDETPGERGETDVETVLLELHHCHLPRLEAAGLITWVDGTVESRLPERPAVEAAVRRHLGGDRTPGTARSGHTDPSRAVTQSAARRAAAEVLAASDRPLGLTELATAVVDADTDAEWVAAHLHHVHLPKLDRAGVARYDPDAKRVSPVTDTTVLDEHPPSLDRSDT